MLLNYPLKPFWNSNFRPCRETKISKVSIWTPLAGLTAPPTPQPPSCFLPRYTRSHYTSLCSGCRHLASLRLLLSDFGQVGRSARYHINFSWEKSFFHSHACQQNVPWWRGLGAPKWVCTSLEAMCTFVCLSI